MNRHVHLSIRQVDPDGKIAFPSTSNLTIRGQDEACKYADNEINFVFDFRAGACSNVGISIRS